MLDWGARQRSLSRARDSRPSDVTRTFTFTGSEDFILRLEQHLAFIHWLGAVGHSAVAGLNVDGDGADHVKITPEIKRVSEADVRTRGIYPDQYEYVSLPGKAEDAS